MYCLAYDCRCNNPHDQYANAEDFQLSFDFFLLNPANTFCRTNLLRLKQQYLRQIHYNTLLHAIEEASCKTCSTCRATSQSSYAHFAVRADLSRPPAALSISTSEERPVRELQHNVRCVLQTSISMTVPRGTSTSCPIVLTQGPSSLTFNILRYRIALPIWVPTPKRQIC